jgi:hypothetical protein
MPVLLMIRLGFCLFRLSLLARIRKPLSDSSVKLSNYNALTRIAFLQSAMDKGSCSKSSKMAMISTCQTNI